ncbi:hypothetical protein EVAR_69390_1 [Eumeta japonica]|uniref:Uncharacterized protein n=1 Tax=Eumeta variegata TaxID=151549 RepID=A0A4C2A2X8_EUMVA|nr:hypothetical protein EVAR_69390_1 [Eumeta japonica]
MHSRKPARPVIRGSHVAGAVSQCRHGSAHPRAIDDRTRGFRGLACSSTCPGVTCSSSQGARARDVVCGRAAWRRARWRPAWRMGAWTLSGLAFRKALKANDGQSAFQDYPKKPKHGSDTLFYYGLLVPHFRLYH